MGRSRIKIQFLILIIFSSFSVCAQNENLIPFSNRLLLNPSFAGYNNDANMWTGLQFISKTKKETYNQYSLTYDTYSEKLKGGVAFYFQQGLIGEVNTNSTELGFTYSGFHFKTNKGKIITSLNSNFLFASKQWFVKFIDNMLDKEIEPPSLPGNESKRYVQWIPQVGILMDLPGSFIGFSSSYSLQLNLAKEGYVNENLPIQAMFYYSKKLKGRQNGLISKSFEAYPELILQFRNNKIVSRASLKFEHVDQTLGVFLQGNYSDNLYILGGTYGWRKDKLRINLTSGVGIPGLSDLVTFNGEITLGYIIPSVYYSKRNPWATRKNKY